MRVVSGLLVGCWWAGGGGAPGGDYLFMLTMAGARSEEEGWGPHLAAEAETEDLLLNIGYSILCNSPGGRMGEVAATKCGAVIHHKSPDPQLSSSVNSGTR